MLGIGFSGKTFTVALMAVTALAFVLASIPIVTNVLTSFAPPIGQTVSWFGSNFWWILPVEIFAFLIFAWSGGGSIFNPPQLLTAAIVSGVALLMLYFVFGPGRILGL
jgi:hypothetical protein